MSAERKKVLWIVLIGLSLLFCTSFFLYSRFNHTYPGDFPNSQWICGEKDINMWVTNTGSCRMKKETENGIVFLYCGFDTINEYVEVWRISEEEYYGELGERKLSQLVLKGTFSCNKAVFRLKASEYDALFGKEENGSLEMCFERQD